MRLKGCGADDDVVAAGVVRAFCFSWLDLPAPDADDDDDDDDDDGNMILRVN